MKLMVPDVTVIMPIYNEEKYISVGLDSLRHQSLSNIEVICVDDGSTDCTYRIIEEMCQEDNRFKVIRTNRVGAGEARNVGLKKATGEFVVFLDGDDIFDKAMLQNAYKACKENKLDICIWDVLELDNVSKIINEDTSHFKIDLFPRKKIFSGDECKFLFNMTSGASWNKMFSRDFLKKNNIEFMNQVSFNDLYMTYSSLLIAERVLILNEKLLTYRIGNGCSLQGNRDATINDAFCAFDKVTDLVKRKNSPGHLRSWKNYLVSCLYSLLISSKSNKAKDAICNYALSSDLINNVVENDLYDFYILAWINLNHEIAIYYKTKYEK